ncbi:peptidase S66 [Actinoplanes sp. OR16]|uniref:S66 peptidase family protein n=1 Tax=Actinoplanes sp. OR16 TaxID=946334 RepID=UPI000F6FC26D|nr:LD-carboxypeptidase [Actinoplanes sp. OR16]BBH68644.1 peptidase S66 [Actinoplanes sp. OR16]
MEPRPLRPGELVALVSPAGPVDAGRAEAAARVLAGWGLRYRFGRHALGRDGLFSGTDEQRLADLDDALRDPQVRGVICLRGGYGVQRIVDRVDFAALRRDPKLIMGFSDVTALHAALWRTTGLVSVHGPTGASLPASAEEARRVLMTADPVTLHGVKSAGSATGVLLGGNLTMLATSAGTPDQLDLRGAILLLEETNEAAYRVDRMLVQLRRSGGLDGLAGVAVGTGLPREIIEEHFAVPALFGLPVGHGQRQSAVPLGAPAHLDAGAGTLTVYRGTQVRSA